MEIIFRKTCRNHLVTLYIILIIANISFNVYVSSFLGNITFPHKKSTRMKHVNQRSVHSSYLFSPNSNFGGWQHNVTSILVYFYDILSLITFWKSGGVMFHAKPKLVSLIRKWSSRLLSPPHCQYFVPNTTPNETRIQLYCCPDWARLGRPIFTLNLLFFSKSASSFYMIAISAVFIVHLNGTIRAEICMTLPDLADEDLDL